MAWAAGIEMEVEGHARSWALYSWHKCRVLEMVRALVSCCSAEEGSEAARRRRSQLRIWGRARGP